jgi:hypothetical protein
MDTAPISTSVPATLSWIHVRFGGSFERQRLRIEIGDAHVHRDEIGVVNARVNRPGGAVEHDLATVFLETPQRRRAGAGTRPGNGRRFRIARLRRRRR